jgi:hypothetical protein
MIETIFLKSGFYLTFFQGIVVVLGLFYFKTFPKPLRFFWGYLAAMIVYNIIEQALLWSVNTYTEQVLPYFTKVGLSDTNFLVIIGRLSTAIFYVSFGTMTINIFKGKVKALHIFILCLIIIFIYIFIDGWRNYGKINPILDDFLLMLFPVLYFRQVTIELPVLPLHKNSYFIIMLWMFLTTLFAFFSSFFGDKLSQTDYELFMKISIFKNILNFLAQIFFIDAFRKAKYLKFLPKTY